MMTSLAIIPESCLAVDLHSPILKRTQLEQPVELTGTIYFRLHDKSYFPPLPENSATWPAFAAGWNTSQAAWDIVVLSPRLKAASFPWRGTNAPGALESASCSR